MSDIQHYIDGKRVDGIGGRWSEVYNPATGERTGRVAFAGAGEVDRAVRAAAAAFPAWAATPPLTRARILFKFRELLDREAGALARLITEEHGKVLSDAQGEVTRGTEVVEFACRSVCASASPRSISRRWYRCGCSRWHSPAATRLFSSRPSATPPRAAASPSS